jgi:hypothetical protein
VGPPLADHRLSRAWQRATRLLIVVGLAAVVAHSLERGWAANLPVSPRPASGGAATVDACDPNGFTFHYALDSTGRITDVTVSAISAGCAGGTLRLTLTNGATSIGQGSTVLPSSGFGGSASVGVSPTPQSDQVTAVHAAIEGP